MKQPVPAARQLARCRTKRTVGASGERLVPWAGLNRMPKTEAMRVMAVFLLEPDEEWKADSTTKRRQNLTGPAAKERCAHLIILFNRFHVVETFGGEKASQLVEAHCPLVPLDEDGVAQLE